MDSTTSTPDSLFLIPRFIAKQALKFLIDSVFDIHVTGLENIPKTGGAVFISNHTDLVDIPVQGCYSERKIIYLGKYELFKPQEDILRYVKSPNSPFTQFPLSLTVPTIELLANAVGERIATQLKAWGGLPIIRNHFGAEKDKKAALNYYDELETYMVEIVKSGEILSIYPEGTRTETGVMGPFKAIAARIAIRGNVPIIPSGIDGAHNASKLENILSGKTYKAKITYNIGKPIQPSEFPQGPEKKAAKELTEILEKRVYALKENPESSGPPKRFVTVL